MAIRKITATETDSITELIQWLECNYCYSHRNYCYSHRNYCYSHRNYCLY